MRKRAVMFGTVLLLGACSSGGEAREFSGPEAHTIEEVQQLLVSAGWGCDALSDVQALSAIPGSGHALRWSDPAGLSRGRGLGPGWWRRGSVAPHHQGQIEALGKHVRRSTNTVLQARQRCGQQGRVWRRGAIVSLPTVPAQPGRDRGVAYWQVDLQ